MKKNRYKTIFLAVISLIIAVRAFAEPYRVHGDCMEPAVSEGQLCFLNRVSPYLRQYKIGDIIVFKHEGKPWISRIVALENDTIEITEDNVLVHGTTLQDAPDIHRNWSDWRHGIYAIEKPFQVPLNHVFVLCDKLSSQHDDSRVFGAVPTESIEGLIWMP